VPQSELITHCTQVFVEVLQTGVAESAGAAQSLFWEQ
jgi:hypothetical protein